MEHVGKGGDDVGATAEWQQCCGETTFCLNYCIALFSEAREAHPEQTGLFCSLGFSQFCDPFAAC